MILWNTLVFLFSLAGAGCLIVAGGKQFSSNPQVKDESKKYITLMIVSFVITFSFYTISIVMKETIIEKKINILLENKDGKNNITKIPKGLDFQSFPVYVESLPYKVERIEEEKKEKAHYYKVIVTPTNSSFRVDIKEIKKETYKKETNKS